MGFRGEHRVAVVLVALLFLATRLSALTGDLGADAVNPIDHRTSPWALVSDVKVVSAARGVEIQITADCPLRASSRRWSDPERFVIDIQGAVFTGDTRIVDVDIADIQSVRIAPLYEQEGRAIRVVVNLASPIRVNLTPVGNSLILTFGSAPVTPRENSVALASNAAPGSAVVPTFRPSYPAPAAIAAKLDDTTSAPSAAVEVAEEKTADDALIFGVGVTGRANDPTLGVDVEHILGPSKKNKKNEPGEGNGGEGSIPHAFHLSGSAIGGYYRADSESGYIFHDASPIASLHLDASGYLYHPGFLSFSVKPQGSLGRQSSENIFPDGQGIAATTTFLGGSTLPLTLSYSRLNRNLVTFGPLDRLAGLEANTYQDSLSANWTLRLKRMPLIAFAFSKFSDSYEPLADLAPKTANSARVGSVDMKQKVMGWNLETRYKFERSSQDLINLFDPTQAPYLFKRSEREARASADHDFGQRLSLNFLAGATRSQNYVQDRPFDQSYRFFTANSILRPNKKLILAFHGGVTNNVVGATLERATSGSGSASAADVPLLLVPSSARLQMTNYSGSAQYSLTKSLRLDAETLRESTHSQDTSPIIPPASTLTSAQAGISWSRRLRFVQFHSHYAANIGNFAYSSTGSSRSSGQKADMGATLGSMRSLELTANLQGSMQDVTGSTYMRDRSWGASLGLSHAFRQRWKVQATYDRAYDVYNFLNQQFSSDTNGFNLVLLNPVFDLSASLNIRNGLSVQTDPRLQYLSSAQAGLLLGAFPGGLIVPTAADWSSASLNIHPVGKFRARGTWLRSRQQLEGAVNNRYTEWEASAGYVFRSLSFDAGYIFHDQNFSLDIFQRNRVFFRVVRDFTIF